MVALLTGMPLIRCMAAAMATMRPPAIRRRCCRDFVDHFDGNRDPTEKVDVLRGLGAALMSRHEIVEKREMFRSEILLTPLLDSLLERDRCCV